ncbi:MAG: histidinol dehydrogenase, partial [Rhodospirillales bacterium]|nr:histidinol dehydrogenase [Rhodospirillales bacterium]
MTVEYLKKAEMTPATGEDDTRQIVVEMLDKIEKGGEDVAREYGVKLDGYEGDIVVGREEIEAAAGKISQRLKDDIRYARDHVMTFAEKQRDSVQEFEVELSDGVFAGQRLIPVTTAGCYVPGGRYAHVASAIMSVATAKVAGVENVVACSAPHAGGGIHPG